MADDPRPYDLVLFGATGFTGGLTAEYLARHAPPATRWALAGRNRDKLEAVRERLATIAPVHGELELLIADVTDPASVDAVARATRVAITTVGPYIHHGEPLVAACAAAGTDYVDLTGEPEFVDRMYVRHHAEAVRTGARLVHCCGFDSIPHDLGVQFTVTQLPDRGPIEVRGFVSSNGTFSGGTFHSAINQFSRARQMVAVARERHRHEPPAAPGRRVHGVTPRPYREAAIDAWAVPLPTIDPQVVLRSARALERYGPDFRYGHYAAVKHLPVALGGGAAIAGVFALAQLPPARRALMKLKDSGDGPTPEQRAKAWFSVRFTGTGGGRRVLCEVKGGDPGYGETSKMLAESGLCLAHDDLPASAGQVTTAVAMGDALRDRLQRAGITFTVLDSEG
jgi:short subunit dehydrogenase-like uncharacterized protein